MTSSKNLRWLSVTTTSVLTTLSCQENAAYLETLRLSLRAFFLYYTTDCPALTDTVAAELDTQIYTRLLAYEAEFTS